MNLIFAIHTICKMMIVSAIYVLIEKTVRGAMMKIISLLKLLLIGYGFVFIIGYLIEIFLETIRLSLKEN